MKKTILFLALILVQCQLFAAKKIVLFKAIEEGIGEQEPIEEVELALQKANQKNIADLLAAIGGETRGNRPVLDLWLVQGAVADLTNEQVAEVQKLPNVEGVYDNARLKMDPPNEAIEVGPTLESLGVEPTSVWGLYETGTYAVQRKYPDVTGKGVRVGILDTGIEARHPEFQGGWSWVSGQGWVHTGPRKVQFRDFVGRLPNPYDDHGHGTHVAGTITGNRVGIARGVDLVVGKILHAEGYGEWSWILEGMQWMADPDGKPATKDAPRLVSNSWGGGVYFNNGAADLNSITPLLRAVRQWRRLGIVPVFAAGNSGASQMKLATVPGGFKESLAVGAYDSRGNIAGFSTRGPAVWRTSSDIISVFKPDLSAPGVRVTSAFIGHQYATWSGTSMATPHVAGSLALMFQVRPKTNFKQVRELILASVRKKMDFAYGVGMLDTYTLVTEAMKR